MFQVTGKLKSGKTFRATVPTTDASDALKTVQKNLPPGDSIASLTLKPADPAGFIKIAEPRTRAASTTPRAKRGRGKRANA